MYLHTNTQVFTINDTGVHFNACVCLCLLMIVSTIRLKEICCLATSRRKKWEESIQMKSSKLGDSTITIYFYKNFVLHHPPLPLSLPHSLPLINISIKLIWRWITTKTNHFYHTTHCTLHPTFSFSSLSKHKHYY